MDYLYVLASGSPRRKQLLKQVIADFTVIASDYNEEYKGTSPLEYVLECSRKKAEDVFSKLSSDEASKAVVIAADTIVEKNNTIYFKPKTYEAASQTLNELNGSVHNVITAVTVMSLNKSVSRHRQTSVSFTLTDNEIAQYVLSGCPMDKAGAYGIQDEIIGRNSSVNGDIDNVIGLPVRLVAELLKTVKTN